VVQYSEISQAKKFLAYLIVGILPLLAVLGIMAATVLVAINPAAQIKKAQETQQMQQQINDAGIR
jgi:hypothetical protein